MSRIAEASARAGLAVPDDPRVDWANERELAAGVLRGGTSHQAAPSSPEAASPPKSDSTGETFSWPAGFDLDEIDLSRDAHARGFRRPPPRSRAPQAERHVEVDDQIPRRHSQLPHELFASPRPPHVSVQAPRRDTAAASRRDAGREPVRAEAPRVTPRWVIVAVALVVLFASAALLTYLLRNRHVAAIQHDVRILATSGLLIPMSDIRVSPRDLRDGFTAR